MKLPQWRSLTFSRVSFVVNSSLQLPLCFAGAFKPSIAVAIAVSVGGAGGALLRVGEAVGMALSGAMGVERTAADTPAEKTKVVQIEVRGRMVS